MRAAEEAGEPINMEAMPPRPHRRRREKKLMTMDEVNERFPLTKYKAWVASRARDGLPTSGGIDPESASRPGSVRDVEGVILPSSPVDTKHSVEDRPATGISDHAPPEIIEPSPIAASAGDAHGEKAQEKGESSQVEEAPLEQVQTSATGIQKQTTSGSEEEDDEDDHIHTAVPPELLTNPGDSCAICIDTLEDDEDIRGLTCGHAFHAACLDPWLTSRRACCPLCKADYYIPKPRPEGETADAERSNRRGHRTNMPQAPPASWGGIRGTPRLILPVRFNTAAVYARGAAMSGAPPDPTLNRREVWAPTTGSARGNNATPGAAEAGAATPNRRWRMGNPFSRRQTGNSTPAEETQQPNTEPSPSQLEAGIVR